MSDLGTDALLARLDSLIAKGREAAEPLRPGFDASPEQWGVYRGWQAQALTCIGDVVGAKSEYHDHFAQNTKEGFQSGALSGVNILMALREDVANGYLRRTADVLAAEVFTDFLDMAGHLLDAGYHVPAASLTGAVLEDGLRRLVVAKSLKVLPGDDIAALNNRLQSKGAYTPLVRKQVDLWAGIRNSADHGKFEDVKLADVRDMHAGVIRFLAERLG
jgi:hypothetical protein